MSYDFPEYGKLKVEKLSGIFSDTSASYKFVFFMALLNLMKESPLKQKFSYSDIEIEMIYIAWFPRTYYKLNFGYSDQLGNIIDKLDLNLINKDKIKAKKEIEKQITPLKSTLLDMVPYRLLSIFINDKNIKKSDDKEVVKWANSLKDNPQALYSFSRDIASKKDNNILISRPWYDYISENYGIIKDFTTYNFLKYMEKRNPNVLNISTKLFPPLREATNLTTSARFWNPIIKEYKIKCIYSDEILDPEKLSIDHYLPWSFVAHDREWNLIPTSASVNSSKSNNLPSRIYFDNFISIQYKALNSAKELNPNSKYLENYFVDLNISRNSLNMEDIKNAYENIFNPLFSLAKSQGFTSNWIWSNVKGKI